MIVTLIPYCPHSRGKDLGFAYNELMARLRDDDWACFIDHDACFTTHDWYAQLEEITRGLTGPCVLTALTNRVGSHWQRAPGVDRDNHAMDYHRRIGRTIQATARTALRDVTHESLMSGVVILLSKETWQGLGGFADGFLGVDNAIHQAARDRGVPVYLMEGVYVYHWYRAGETFSEPLHVVPVGESPELIAGRRILLIGHDVGPAGEGLAALRPASLKAIELDRSALGRTRQRLGDVVAGDEDGGGVDFADGSFDGIVAADLLERVTRPDRILRRLRRWLAPEGRLVTSVASVRSHPVVERLLTGRWVPCAGQEEARRSIRFFTRREIEKLLSRAGFSIRMLTPLPGPGHREWVAQGRPGTIRVGRLHIAGLQPADIEEFHALGYRVEADAAEVPDHGLTSIIVVTYNQLPFTRECFDSLRRRTDEPYELIVIDNASTDGTVDFLRSQADVKLIENPENRGFPAAVNQGIARATGSHILLLNNDTVLTTGWLGRLLRALHSDPAIGLAGPCSNCVSGPQQLEPGYEDLAGLDGFAWDWGRVHDGEREETNRLVGFCLLIRRTVVDAIGLLDEQFGIGCFDDDDYCLRAIRAGFRAVIARDAFVHHYGGRTFLGSGVDYTAIMRENERRFRDKWGLGGETDPSPSPAPASPALPPPSTRFAAERAADWGLLLRPDPVRLSLCMIVRDSAGTLPAALVSVRPWVDEMVIVDTGSTDETPQIVEEFGGRLFHFPWCDDFAAARNESLRHARGDWIFWMDSDDTIPTDCGSQIRALIQPDVDPGVLGYVMQVHCPGGGDTDGPDSDVTMVDHVKLIRNRPDLRFEGRIHEQVLPAIRRAGGMVAWTDLYVVHSGSDPGPEAQDRKRRRDLHLLHLELREQPEHPFTLFNLGMTYSDGGRFEEAEEFLVRSIRQSSPDESHLRKAYALLVYAQMRLGRREQAVASCRRGRELFPEDAELRFREGVLLHELDRLEEAVLAYRDVLASREERHFRSIDRGLTGFKARQNLAVVYTDLGDLERAEAEWRQVTREVPGYRPGWHGLGEILLRRGRLAEAHDVAERCLGWPALRVEGRLLRSRLAMMRDDVAEALVEVERAITVEPGDRAALEARCQLLFEHGEPSEADRALRTLIDRDPADASAHHNLGMLLLRLKRYDEAARSFRQALRHRADSPATYLHLGYALKETGRLEEAAAAWQQVLRLEPDHAAAREELGRAVRRSGFPA